MRYRANLSAFAKSKTPGEIRREFFVRNRSEVHFGVVVAAFQQLFHFLYGRLTGVGARAGVADRVDRDVVQSFQEDVFGDEALFGGIAVRAVVLDAVRDVEVVVHLAEHGDEQIDFFVVVLAAEMDEVGNLPIALLRGGILRIEFDDLGQIHRVRRAVDDVRAVVRKRRARLVRHRMHDAEQRVGERHAREALRVVHAVPLLHVAVIRADEIGLDHLDRVQRQRIGVIAVRRGDVRFDRVRDRVHTRMRHQLLGHGLREFGIDDRHVGRDFEVRDGIFDALLIVGDDGERRDFRRRARRRRNGAEFRLAAQFGNAEHLAHIFKRDVGIFVLDPHRLRRVDGRAAADRDNPVRSEIDHRLRALHDRFDGRIRFDPLEQPDFHPRFFQIGNRFVEEAESLHRTAAHADDRLLSLEGLEDFHRAFAVIEITG